MLRKRFYRSGNAYEICPNDVEAELSLTESAIKTLAKPQKHEKKTATHFLMNYCRRFLCIKPNNVSDSDDEEVIYTSTPHVK